MVQMENGNFRTAQNLFSDQKGSFDMAVVNPLLTPLEFFHVTNRVLGPGTTRLAPIILTRDIVRQTYLPINESIHIMQMLTA